MDTATRNRITTLVCALSHYAALRALSKDWEDEPLFGILVSKDVWAVKYQAAYRELNTILDGINMTRPLIHTTELPKETAAGRQ